MSTINSVYNDLDWRLLDVSVSERPEMHLVKLEELHIATARKPLIHQNQPVAQYLYKIQSFML